VFTVAALAPSVDVGVSVSVPAVVITMTALEPAQVGRERKEIAIPAAVVAVAALEPVVATGVAVEVPAAVVTMAAVAPVVAIGAGGDPYFANVSLLLPMDGSFTDVSSNALTVTVNGGAAISTTDPKFGSGCALLDGSGDYLGVASSALFNVGGGASFTAECFVRRAGSAAGAFMSMRNAGVYAPFELISTGSNLQLLAANAAFSNWSVNTFAGSNTLPLGEYAHVALIGDGANLKVFVNGTQVISATQAGWASANYPLYIGGGGDNQFDGRIDEVRFTLNVARYTSNFTPPTAPFPTS
jgi:hypothetical protein